MAHRILDIKKIDRSRCNYCKAEIDHVEVVETLAGTYDSPRETGHACPECGRLDSFTALDEDEIQERYIEALEQELKVLRKAIKEYDDEADKKMRWIENEAEAREATYQRGRRHDATR